MKTAVKIWIIASWLAAGTLLEAASFLGISFDKGGDAMLADLKNSQAREWRKVGDTFVFQGDIRIPYKDLVFYADNAIIDIENRDIELTGNVRLYRVINSSKSMTINDLERVMALSGLYLSITGYTTNGLGEQQVSVSMFTPGEVLKADRVTGNLLTGVFAFDNLNCDFGTFVASAKAGERKPSGEIVLNEVEISTCSYLADNRSHYSVFCDTAKVFPHEAGVDGMRGYNSDFGEHSIWAYNCWVKAFDMPLIWLPMFYKPKDESLGLFQMAGGESSDYGYYGSISRKFTLSEYPYSWIRPRMDWYELRGVGYGATGGIYSEQSRTELFAYGIGDLRPYEGSEVEKYRLDIPKYRYRFALDNVTHITPRLDFRGKFDISSDYYFTRDYFGSNFNADPEPATYGALEYQFDRASLSVLMRPQVNSFYTTAQQLPQIKLDMPRQELFGTGVYYQGTHSVDYLSMRWREFDEPRVRYKGTPREQVIPGPEDYQTMRFDSVNFLYYPFKLFDVINLTPRAGVRLTDYTDSSKNKVSDEDIGRILAADQPTSMTTTTLNNYDNRGGNRFRIAEELGIEASMKFYNAWQNVRSPFFKLDGLRHVFEPYTNYTFIPDVSESREHLYYFDDIDRLKEMNFIRFGMRNRLQTRTGSVTRPQLINWLSMDNYWDLFFKNENGYNSIGDLGTILRFEPGNGFSLSAECSFDVGGNYEREDVYRNGKNVGRPGLDIAQLNNLSLSMKYALLDDLIFGVTYNYEDAYRSRSAYSMGSTLASINAASSWGVTSSDMTQNVVFDVQFPVTPDRDLRGRYAITYDFYKGSISDQSLQVIKTLHCWDIIFEMNSDLDWDSKRSTYNREFSFRVSAFLNGMISPLNQVQRQMVNSAQNYRQKSGRDDSFAFF